jgi:hypothetical protein
MSVVIGPWKHDSFSPSSGGDGGMEARVARLEASVSHIEKDIVDIKADIKDIRRDMRDDFRLLFKAIIASGTILAGLIAGVAGLMAKGFKWF